jgi:hypothetical protein
VDVIDEAVLIIVDAISGLFTGIDPKYILHVFVRQINS